MTHEPCRCRLCVALLAAAANAERNERQRRAERAQARRNLALVEPKRRRDAA